MTLPVRPQLVANARKRRAIYAPRGVSTEYDEATQTGSFFVKTPKMPRQTNPRKPLLANVLERGGVPK